VYFFVQVKRQARHIDRKRFVSKSQPAKVPVSKSVCLSSQISAGTVHRDRGFSHSALARSRRNWQSTVSKEPPGNFPELRPLRATYRFGWSGFYGGYRRNPFHQAIRGQVSARWNRGGRSASSAPCGSWDVNHQAVANAENAAPNRKPANRELPIKKNSRPTSLLEITAVN